MSARTETVLREPARAASVAELVDRLSEPATAAALTELLDNVATLNGLLTAASSFLARGEEIMDNVAESYREVTHVAGDRTVARTVDTAKTLAGQSLPLAERLADTEVLGKLATSSLLDPALFDMLEILARSVHTAHVTVASEPGKHEQGIFGVPRAMRDPDVKRGVGFVLAVAKELGRALGPTTSTTRA